MEDYNNRNYENQTPTTGSDPKVVSIVSYLFGIGLIVAYVLNNPKTALGSFHIRQALGIYLLFAVSTFLAFLGPFAIVGWLFGIVLWILGLLSAIQGEMKTVPLVGDKFQEWFRSL